MSTRIISLRLSEQVVSQADELAKAHGISRSKLVELLLQQAVDGDSQRLDTQRLREKADHPFFWKGA
jgi:antitoxin component of RelBE/YafQ-DinJ toxin-antitoxin module